MADNYIFKDANKATKIRAAKELEANVFANKDIIAWDNGTFADIAESANVTLGKVFAFNEEPPSIFLLANVNRKGLIIQNLRDTDHFLIKYGDDITLESATIIVYPWGQWVMPKPIWKGNITAIHPGTGFFINALVTELT